MRLDALVVAFPAWAGVLPPCRRQANTREGVPVVRRAARARSLLGRRLALGLTQSAVADRLGMSRCTVQRVEARRAIHRARADLRRTYARIAALYRTLEGGL